MSSRTKGLQDFQRIWGARELMDFWAVGSNKSELWKKIDNEQKSNDLGSELKKAAMEKAPNERKKYYENLPFTKLEKQQMKDDLSESYFLGANVYYQDLKEYDKAKKMLEELNAKHPDNKFQINAWYLLARIAQDQKNMERANYFIELISKQGYDVFFSGTSWMKIANSCVIPRIDMNNSISSKAGLFGAIAILVLRNKRQSKKRK